MIRTGLVLSLSGPDGSGKSTITELLKGRLEELGCEPVTLWTRFGYTPGFEKFKGIARKLLGRRVPQQGDTTRRNEVMRKGGVKGLWLALAVADLLITYGVRVRLSARRGRVAICDRHIWDALIDRMMYYPESKWVDGWVQRGYGLLGRKPDRGFLLQVPLEVARARCEGKDEPFPDPPELREARYLAYGALTDQKELKAVDATLAPETIVSEIIASLPKK